MKAIPCFVSACLGALGALLVPAIAHASGDLHVEGGAIKDAQGATVVLRGVDVAGNSKVPPFRPMDRPELLDPLQRFGMNAMRLLFTWEAYEPSPGAYDETYLDYYVKILDAARARGIWAIVDFHQDAFSRAAIGGCGEGFPLWALPPTIPAATPLTGKVCADWGRRMVLDDQLKEIWNAFYADTSGARTRYLAMVERVAGRLASHPAVLGYDMINEPGGDEPTQIGPLHEDAAAAIRRADPNAILFVSPAAILSGGGQTKLSKPTFSNFVYAPHFYDSVVLLLKRWGNVSLDSSFDLMRSKSTEWNVPLLLGEFGAPGPTDGGPAYMRVMYDQLDRTFASGTQWVYTPGWTDEAKDGWNEEDFSIVDQSGTVRANYVPRPYAPRIAGTPVSIAVHEEASKSTIDLEWDHDPARGATVLFVPDTELFGAANVVLEPKGEGLTCTLADRHASCTSTTSGRMHLHVRGEDTTSNRCGLFGIEAIFPVVVARLRRRKR